MLKSIREIGMFMIAAQAVIHFAPGKQYEKYIKSVSGIIILLLFLKPFLQISGAAWQEPDAVLERMKELADMPDFPEWEEGTQMQAATGTGVGGMAVQRMETEMRELLNREMEGEDYCVKQVSLRLEEDPSQGGDMTVSEVEITLTETAVQEEGRIGIEEIVIGDVPDPEDQDVFFAYRARFAALLGIEEERVEVRRDGRG